MKVATSISTTGTELSVFLGEVALGQQGFVQVIGDRPGPVDVKRLPVPARRQRGMEMVEQGHQASLLVLDRID